MDAPVTSLKSIIDSLNEIEHSAKATFQQCRDMMYDVMEYSSDKHNDLVTLHSSMRQIAERQKEIAALNHATLEISSLSDRSCIKTDEAVSRFEDSITEFLTEADIDDEQKSFLSSLDNYIHENQVSEQQQMDDSELLVVEAKQSFKDPLTQRIMEDPVKSKTCNHAYERSSIIEYLAGTRKKCPYPGCQTVLKREDLVDHFVLKMKLLNIVEKDEDHSD